MDTWTQSALIDAVPESVLTAVAAAISPAEIGEPGGHTSQMVHRAMAVTFATMRDELARLAESHENAAGEAVTILETAAAGFDEGYFGGKASAYDECAASIRQLIAPPAYDD